MRVVLDTNVLLSGVASHGLCEGVLAICFRDHVVVLSEHILDEFVEHYMGKLEATKLQAAIVIDWFREFGETVVPTTIPPSAFGDADDLPVLGTAVAGEADYLVTGDRDLLAMGSFHGIPIVSPRQLYDIIRASR